MVTRVCANRPGACCRAYLERIGKLTGGLHVSQETPIDFCEPLVLLDLGGAALAAQTGPFPIIEETRDDVLARAWTAT